MAEQPRVTLSGPLFSKDIETTVKGAIRKTVQAVAKAGQDDYKAALRTGHGYQTGQYKRSMTRKSRGFTSTVYSRDARKSTWLEGTQARQRSGRVKFKGYALFRDATARTDRTAGEEARRLVDEIVRELGG